MKGEQIKKFKQSIKALVKTETGSIADWIFVPPSPHPALPKNLYVEILACNVMILGGGSFERWLGHKGGAPVNGLAPLQTLSLCSSPLIVKTQWEGI